MKIPKLTALDWVVVAFAIFFIISEYVRIYITVPLGDETIYVGMSILTSIGAKPFYHEMFIQQTASLLFEPLAAAWYFLFGKFAIMLFVRHLYYIWLLGMSWVAFRYARKRMEFALAVTFSLTAMTGAIYGLTTLGYNNIGTLGFGSFAMLALMAIEEQSMSLSVWAGVMAFLTMAAYPTMLGGVVTLTVFAALANWKLGRPWFKTLLRINLIAGGLLILYVGELALRFGWSNMWASYEFTAAHSEGGPFWPKLNYGFWLFQGFAPWPWLIFLLYALWFVLWERVGMSLLLFLVPMGVFIASGVKPRPENGSWAQAFVFLGLLAGVVPVIYAWRKDFANSWSAIVLWGASLIMVPVLCWTSGMTYYSTHYAGLYGFLATLVLAHAGNRWKWLPIPALVLPMLFSWQKWEGNFRNDEQNITNLTYMMDWGAYAGIWTYEEQYKYLKQVQQDIDATSVNAHSTLFYDIFVEGYMMSDLFPLTRTWLMHPLSYSSRVRPLFRDFYTDPKNRPDVVFRFTAHQAGTGWVDATPTRFLPAKDVFWYYLPDETGDYTEVLKRPNYSVYKKKSLVK